MEFDDATAADTSLTPPTEGTAFNYNGTSYPSYDDALKGEIQDKLKGIIKESNGYILYSEIVDHWDDIVSLAKSYAMAKAQQPVSPTAPVGGWID